MTPGQGEYAGDELRQARASLREAVGLLDLELPDGATSRLYYAVFHAARAALIVGGRSAKTHSGQISLFNEAFGTTPLLGELLDLRAQADYQRGVTRTIDEIRELVTEADTFIARCEELVAAEGRKPLDDDPPPDL